MNRTKHAESQYIVCRSVQHFLCFNVLSRRRSMWKDGMRLYGSICSARQEVPSFCVLNLMLAPTAVPIVGGETLNFD